MQYIGITGFMNWQETETVLSHFDICDPKLMVGVLVSSKTLEGIPTRWPNRFPPIDNVPTIFSSSGRTFNTIHYCPGEGHLLPGPLIDWVDRWVAAGLLDGIQFNACWPNCHEIEQAHELLREKMDLKIILQIGQQAFEEADQSPTEIVNRLTDWYGGLIDGVLLDLSGGYGQELDPDYLRPFLAAIHHERLALDLGIAGGLWAENLHLIEPLLEESPDLSIDAEGRLRDDGDHLDLAKASAYVSVALELFG